MYKMWSGNPGSVMKERPVVGWKARAGYYSVMELGKKVNSHNIPCKGLKASFKGEQQQKNFIKRKKLAVIRSLDQAFLVLHLTKKSNFDRAYSSN